MPFQDRCFLVTGASGHVGRHTVARLLAEGARIAGVDRAPGAPPEPRHISIAADLTDEAAVERAFDEAEKAIGPLWGVLHIAGGWAGGNPVRETPVALFEQMLAINLRTSFLVGRAAMRRLHDRGGRIVLVGSYPAAASAGFQSSGAYNVTKAGVIALTRVLAEEGREAGVLANCIAPGTIDTETNRAAMPKADFSRWVPLDAIAEALLALASPASAINGAVVTLPGR